MAVSAGQGAQHDGDRLFGRFRGQEHAGGEGHGCLLRRGRLAAGMSVPVRVTVYETPPPRVLGAGKSNRTFLLFQV